MPLTDRLLSGLTTYFTALNTIGLVKLKSLDTFRKRTVYLTS